MNPQPGPSFESGTVSPNSASGVRLNLAFSTEKSLPSRGSGGNAQGAEHAGAAGNSGGGKDGSIKELLERLDNDHELMCELLQIFRDQSKENLENAKVALQAQDLREVMRAAHTMKGLLKNLSMNPAAEIAFALQTASREGAPQQAETRLVGKMEAPESAESSDASEHLATIPEER